MWIDNYELLFLEGESVPSVTPDTQVIMNQMADSSDKQIWLWQRIQVLTARNLKRHLIGLYPGPPVASIEKELHYVSLSTIVPGVYTLITYGVLVEQGFIPYALTIGTRVEFEGKAADNHQ